MCSDTITPVDVGLRDDNLEDGRGFGFFESNFLKNSARVARWAQPITYLHVYECDAFSVCGCSNVQFGHLLVTLL